MAKKKDITEDESKVKKKKTSAEKSKSVENKTSAAKSDKKKSGEAAVRTTKKVSTARTKKNLAGVDLAEALQFHFGFSSFKGNQKEIIENVLAGKDTFVLMPTGGGKSLCYQLPSLIMEGTALVISPLIALMKNQVDAMRNFSEEDRLISAIAIWRGRAILRARFLPVKSFMPIP